MKKIIFIGILIIMVGLILACDDKNNDLTRQRNESVEQRVDTMDRAEALLPVPHTQNFPLRQLLIEYTIQSDLVNHPWYTYIMSDNGQITHYFVSTTVPVSTNAFLGSTESIYRSDDGTVILTAPSLDGIYYGGGGSISSLNGWIFKDASSGAIGIVYGMKIFTSEAPLILETEPMLLQVSTGG